MQTHVARRESACPVHFIWDGHGRGRWFVRLGFWFMCAVLMVWTGMRAFGFRFVPAVLETPAMVLIAVYAVGQLLSFIDKKR